MRSPGDVIILPQYDQAAANELRSVDSGATGMTSSSELLLCGVVPVNMEAVTAHPRTVLVRDDCVINQANHTTVVGSRNLQRTHDCLDGLS